MVLQWEYFGFPTQYAFHSNRDLKTYFKDMNTPAHVCMYAFYETFYESLNNI